MQRRAPQLPGDGVRPGARGTPRARSRRAGCAACRQVTLQPGYHGSERTRRLDADRHLERDPGRPSRKNLRRRRRRDVRRAGTPTSSSTTTEGPGSSVGRQSRARSCVVGDALGGVDDEARAGRRRGCARRRTVVAGEDARPAADVNRDDRAARRPSDAEQIHHRRRKAPQALRRQIVGELRVRIGRAVVGDPQRGAGSARSAASVAAGASKPSAGPCCARRCRGARR